MMKELAQNLIEKANLSEEQALAASAAVRGFLEEKLPEAVKGPVLGFLNAERLDAAADKARQVVGGLLEKVKPQSP